MSRQKWHLDDFIHCGAWFVLFGAWWCLGMCSSPALKDSKNAADTQRLKSTNAQNQIYTASTKIEQYNSLEVQKYNADTLELFFYNPKVKTEFDNALKKNVYDGKMHVFGQSGDTIRIKFDDKRFQRQFEKQWNKYRGYKLNNINSNIKKRK